MATPPTALLACYSSDWTQQELMQQHSKFVSSQRSREKITIMTSPSSHRTVTRRRPAPNCVTHDDHLALRNRVKRALAHSHDGPLEGKVHPGTSSVFWCVIKAGTLRLRLGDAQRRQSAALSADRKPGVGWGGAQRPPPVGWMVHIQGSPGLASS